MTPITQPPSLPRPIRRSRRSNVFPFWAIFGACLIAATACGDEFSSCESRKVCAAGGSGGSMTHDAGAGGVPLGGRSNDEGGDSPGGDSPGGDSPGGASAGGSFAGLGGSGGTAGTAGGAPTGGTEQAGGVPPVGGAPAEGGSAAGGKSAQGGATSGGGGNGGGGADSCNIGSVLYPRGVPNPAGACSACLPEKSTSSWSLQSDGTSCDTGKICQAGACKSGCWIGSAFVATGTPSPSNPCQVCAPAMSTTTWSPGTSAKCVQAISAGGSHTCAIVNGGVRCWGANTNGQLGDGNTGVDTVTPVQVQGLTSGVTAVAAGESHTCAVANGAALCWGSGALGALGNNSTTSSAVPVQVQGLASGVTAIAAGNSYTCAAVNGAAYCWGDGSHGRLARDVTTSTLPLAIHAIVESGVTAIAAGREHGCALVNSGVADSSVICWGDDLGGTYLNVNPLLSSSTKAIAGDSASHNCVIMSDGSARCWGKNTVGELGSNSSGDLAQVEGLASGVTSIAAGLYSSCAVVNGGARCWGSAATLGNGVQDNSSYNAKPVQVKGLTSGVTAIDLGDHHACAIVNGGVRCWGTNNNGQVGTSAGLHEQTPYIIAEPVAVSLP